MFEQELYSYESPEVRTQQGDLFYNYEIKNWNFDPRLYKIIGISAVANILALVVIGSTGLLTARGCDSPFVGRVCQVLDTVYVGSLIFGTESEYADVDYTKTELSPDEEVTFIDTTGIEPPLSYPAGYFQIANPEQQFTNVTDPMAGFPGSTMIPGIPSNPTLGGSGLLNTPPVAPKSNPNAVEGDLPTGSPLDDSGANENPTIDGDRKGRRGGRVGGSNSNSKADQTNSNTNTSNPTVAEKTDEAKVDEWGVYINKRPMRVEAKESLEEIDAGKVKIDTPFKVVISATLGLAEDGKTVVLKDPKPVRSNPPVKNDPAMEKFVQDWILAVGDAGWLGHLTRLVDPKPKSVVITVEQNETNFIASLKADRPTENLANQQAASFKLFMDIAKAAASGDNKMFLESASVTAEGKNMVVNFSIPKPVVQEMIMRKLAEEKAKETKPEGNAITRPENRAVEK